MGLAAVIVLAVLGAVPLSEGAAALVNRLVITLVPPRILPKLDFSKGIPAACRTLVAVPAMLRSRLDVHQLLERLEVHYLANPDGDIRFALLSDWGDAPEAVLPGDKELLLAAQEGMADLNERYGPMPDGGSRFLLLHRERKWNPREGKWMGWERKRGKLQELNRLLRGDRTGTYILSREQAASIPTNVKYVITLDADTRLPKGAAARLAGCLAHPLNRARSTRQGRVTEGYGILQPRVVPGLPEERERTPFHWITSGFAAKRSPTEISCHSGWIRSALRRPKLSSRSQLYQPARSVPICTSHGHTRAGGASIVVAIVALRGRPESNPRPGTPVHLLVRGAPAEQPGPHAERVATHETENNGKITSGRHQRRG